LVEVVVEVKLMYLAVLVEAFLSCLVRMLHLSSYFNCTAMTLL